MAIQSVTQDIDERANLTSTNKLELLLFRLGENAQGISDELYGINVFKIREIMAMPHITEVAGSAKHLLGVVNIRDQVIPVIDLPGIVGCKPVNGLKLILITEFARATQAFAVEAVDDIVRLDWNQVLPAEASGAGGLVTSIVRLESDKSSSRLAQVLDVEAIMRVVFPPTREDTEVLSGQKVLIKHGALLLAADDSHVARALIGQTLDSIHVPYTMTKSGKEAWEKLIAIADTAAAEGVAVADRVALVLTDLEMPEMDGFTLIRNMRKDPRFKNVPVIVHSSLSGDTNEEHVKNAGADAYVAKFVAEELAQTIRKVLSK